MISSKTPGENRLSAEGNTLPLWLIFHLLSSLGCHAGECFPPVVSQGERLSVCPSLCPLQDRAGTPGWGVRRGLVVREPRTRSVSGEEKCFLPQDWEVSCQEHRLWQEKSWEKHGEPKTGWMGGKVKVLQCHLFKIKEREWRKKKKKGIWKTLWEKLSCRG